MAFAAQLPWQCCVNLRVGRSCRCLGDLSWPACSWSHPVSFCLALADAWTWCSCISSNQQIWREAFRDLGLALENGDDACPSVDSARMQMTSSHMRHRLLQNTSWQTTEESYRRVLQCSYRKVSIDVGTDTTAPGMQPFAPCESFISAQKLHNKILTTKYSCLQQIFFSALLWCICLLLKCLCIACTYCVLIYHSGYRTSTDLALALCLHLSIDTVTQAVMPNVWCDRASYSSA